MIARVVAPVSLLLLLALQVGSLPTLHAGTLVQQLVASDGAAGDQFGIDVDVDGDTLVVGAYLDDVEGNVDQGSAYVFVRSGGVWIQQAKLVSPAGIGHSEEHFGYRVAVSGDNVLVGAPRSGPPTSMGRAYLFVRSAGVWTLTFETSLTSAPQAGGLIGADVEIDGDVAVVGATGVSEFRGRVTIYHKFGPNWILQQHIFGDFPGNFFGSSLALERNVPHVPITGRLVVGTNPTEVVPGHAKVYERLSGIWEFVANLGGGMGQVAAEAHTVVMTRNHQLAENTTKMLVGTCCSWVEQAQFATPWSRVAAVNGDIALVGAPPDFVHVFSRTAGVWTQRTSLDNPESADHNTNFGHNIALDGTSAVVGMPGLNVGANAAQGAVRVFNDLLAPPPPPPPPGNTPAPPVPPLPPVPPTGPPPTITAIPDQTVLINGVVGPLSFTVDGRILADALDVAATSSDPVLVAPSSLVLGRISGAVRTLTLRPADGRTGSATITITVSDGYYSTSTRFLLTVQTTVPPPAPPPGPALPGAPRDVVATLSGGGVDLTWREPSSGPVRRYAIAGGRAAGESSLPVQATRDGALSARIDGLPPTTYSLRVYAIGTAGLGPPSTDVAFTVPDLGGPVLAPPFGLRVIEQARHRVTITWEAPVIGAATSMRIDAGGTLDTLVPMTTIVERRLTGELLAPQWVQVREMNGAATSAPTQPLHVTFDAPCTAPPRAPILLPVSFLAGRGTFAWLPAEGAMASRYRVEITPLLGPARIFETFGGSSLVLPVSPGSFRAVRVFAINGCGETGSP